MTVTINIPSQLPALTGNANLFLRVNAGENGIEWAATASGGITIGTTAIASGTVGRVLFEGAGNVVQQNAAFVWNNTDNRLILGTEVTPDANARLVVIGKNTSATVGFAVHNSTGNNNALVVRDDGYVGINNSSLSSTGGLSGDLLGLKCKNVASTPFVIKNSADNRTLVDIATTSTQTTLNIRNPAGTTTNIISANSIAITAGGFLSTSLSAINTNNTAGATTFLNLETLDIATEFISYRRNNSNAYLASSTSFVSRDKGTGDNTAKVLFSANSNTITNNFFAWTFQSGSIPTSAGEFMRLTSGSLLIGTSTEVASSIVTLESSTKGFLPPRMTGAQAEAIATPAEGLMVYATNAGAGDITAKGWWGYDGTNWLQLN